jgi:hypothetical protein
MAGLGETLGSPWPLLANAHDRHVHTEIDGKFL